MEALQASALPLGHATIKETMLYLIAKSGQAILF
jgi:hypothetical protein